MKSKLIDTIVTVAAIGIIGAGVVLAGWMKNIETSTSSQNHEWWNTNTPGRMIYVDEIRAAWTVATSNNWTVYGLDASTNQYRIETTTATDGLQYVVVTPAGNGTIRVPYGHGLRFTQTVASAYNLIISPTQPQ